MPVLAHKFFSLGSRNFGKWLPDSHPFLVFLSLGIYLLGLFMDAFGTHWGRLGNALGMHWGHIGDELGTH